MPPSSSDGDASPKRPFGQERRLGRNSSSMSESRVNRPERILAVHLASGSNDKTHGSKSPTAAFRKAIGASRSSVASSNPNSWPWTEIGRI